MAEQMAVYTFEGPSVLYVHPSLAAAEGYFEAVDVEADEFVFFGQDGTVIRPSVDRGRVVLMATDEQRVGELRQRLLTYLTYSEEADPALIDDPTSLARLLLQREAELRESRWLARLSSAVGRRRRR